MLDERASPAGGSPILLAGGWNPDVVDGCMSKTEKVLDHFLCGSRLIDDGLRHPLLADAGDRHGWNRRRDAVKGGHSGWVELEHHEPCDGLAEDGGDCPVDFVVLG